MQSGNEFAAKTELEIVLEDFCRIEVGLRIVLSTRRGKKDLDLENFCPRRKKGERELDLEKFCPSKREKKGKVRQVRRGVRSPVRLSGKASYDRVRFPDRLQNNSMLPLHATNKKKACNSHGLAAGANRKKARVRNFCKNSLCNSIGFFISSAFIFFYILHQSLNKVSFN